MKFPKPAKKDRKKRDPWKLVNGGDYRSKVKAANELWRRLIYAKEPSGDCPRCFCRKWHDAAHFFAKGPYPSVRFDLSNAAPVCRVCHRRIDSDHEAKIQFAIAYLGPDEYEALRLRTLGRGKADIDLVLLDLARRVANLDKRACAL